MISGIRTALGDRGFCHIPGPHDEAAFRAIAGSLGPIVHETSVRVNPARRSYLAGEAAVPFHTDHPDVRYIAWLCVAQDPADGTSRFVDGLEAARGLPGLSRVRVQCPPLEGLQVDHERPLLTSNPDQVFFAPWLRTQGDPAALADLLEFRLRLDSAATHEVQLVPRDVVVIDNRRMLHGRRPLSMGSPRHLHRLWIGQPAPCRAPGARPRTSYS
jgi:hypothetical protein